MEIKTLDLARRGEERGFWVGPCLAATCHGQRFKSEPTAGHVYVLFAFILKLFFLPLFWNPFSALCPGRVALRQPQPFFCRAGRWAGHWQDAGRWHTVIAYLSARLYPSTGCQDMQTRQPRMAGNKFGKKREHKTKAKQLPCVITGREAGGRTAV